MYNQGQHFSPHVAHMSQQQYSHPNLPNEHYSYEQASIPYEIPTHQQQQKEDKIRSTSSVPSTITEDNDSDSDYEHGKRYKLSKSRNKANRTETTNNAKVVGRHQDEVRTLFKYENGTWFCPICSKSVSPRAGRMKAHFEKCRTLAEYKIAKEVDSIAGASSCLENNLESEESSSTESINQPSINFKSSCKKQASLKSENNNKKPGGKGHGGRLKSDVWAHYEEKQGLFYCKRCSKRVSSKAHRLTQHLATSCINSPTFIAAELRKVGLRASTDGASMHESQEIRQQFELRNGQWFCQKCSKLVSSSIEKMKKHLEIWCGITMGGTVGTSMTAGDVSTPSSNTTSGTNHIKNSMLNTQLGKFIFRSNLPFNVVEDPEFIQFVSMLVKNGRGNYKPPSVGDVEGPILKEVHHEIQQRMTKEIANKCVTLIQYGWSNMQLVKCKDGESPSQDESNQSHVIIHCLHNGKSSFFLNVMEISDEDAAPQMAPITCLKLLDNSMDSATKLYNCKLAGVLTDLAIRETVQSCRPNLHVYGCYKELFNELGKDIAKSTSINSALRVQEYFCSLVADNVIPILEGVNIVTPDPDEDWKSQLDSLNSFLIHNEKYKELTAATFHFAPEIKAILDNQDLSAKVEQLLVVLTSLADAYKKIKNDTSVIADAINLWLILLNNETITGSHKEKIREAFSDCVTPMAIAAYLLHPVYRGQNMDLEVQEVGRIWLLERDPMFVVFQSALERADSSYFPTSLLNPIVAKQMAPSVWWEDAGKWPRIPAGLTEVAVSLMILPASNMMSEFFPTIVKMVSSQKKILGWEKTLQICNAYFDLQK